MWIPKVYNGKQKTFFFFTYDGTRNQDPRFSIRSVPTDAGAQRRFQPVLHHSAVRTAFA